MVGEIIGQYKIVRKIGEGGMATVYEAVHVRLGKRVAVKILNEELVRKTSIRQRFENEARIMAELNHPNIVNIFDYVDNGYVLAIIMELLEGISLKEYLKQKGRLDKKEAIEIFLQVLSAFDLAHQRGIIHRDIKPSNIFIETHKNNNVKILDFGIAKLLTADHSTTHHGAQMGSPLYMSPEQVKDAKDVDNLSDIYSLGVVLFHMLAGKPPISDTTLSRFDIFNKIVYEPLPPLPGYPDIDPIIRKATQKNKYDRYLTCREFARDLKMVLEGQSVAPPIGVPAKKNKFSAMNQTTKRKKPASNKFSNRKQSSGSRIILWILLLLMLGGGGFWGYHFYKNGLAVKKNKFTGEKLSRPASEKVNRIKPQGKKSKAIPFEVLIRDAENNLVARAMAFSDDGGYVLAGYSIAPDSDDADMWIYKMDKKGKKIWQKIYGGGKRDEAVSIIRVNDGFIIGGNTKSKGAGKDDIWLMKIDKKGNLVWERVFGTPQSEKLMDMQSDGVGNIVLVGQKKTRRKGYQAYILVVDENTGNELFSKTIGKTKKDRLTKVNVIGDKYYFGGSQKGKTWLLITDRKLNEMTNRVYSFGRRITAMGRKENIYLAGTSGDEKAFVMKMDKNGSKIWTTPVIIQKKPFIIMPVSIVPVATGEFILAVNASNSSDGKGEGILMKVDASGKVVKTHIFKDTKKSIFINDMRMMQGKVLVINEIQDQNKHYTVVKSLNMEFQAE